LPSSLFLLHNRHPARDGRLREGTPLGGAGAVPAATAIHRGRGRFWATSRPARDRTARCSLHWRRGGSSRLHPVIPGSAARAGTTAVERRKASGPPPDLPRKRGRRRGQGPRPRRCGGVTPHWMRLSALRFPRFCARGLSCRREQHSLHTARAFPYRLTKSPAAHAPRECGRAPYCVRSFIGCICRIEPNCVLCVALL
jgi:hypothetical protein